MGQRPARFFVLALTLALLLAALERAATALRSRWTEPGRGASWIWAPGVLNSGEPVAFFAVRDFEIAALAGHKAEVAVAADETYTLFVNGRRVGAGAYRAGAPADLYDVTADLRAGKNRLAVELASGRGAGGLLASLRLDGRPLVVTDGDWRVFRRFHMALLRGSPLAGGEPAQVWQLHPTGRWKVAPPRPRPALPALPGGPVMSSAIQMQRASRKGWRDAPAHHFPRRLGPWLLFDWGHEVTGFLTLELATTDGSAGLLFVGSEVPDRDAKADAVVVPVPGKGWWIDVRPRTFRYAYLAGLELRRTPEVELVGEELARELEPPADTGPAGVFGIAPPRPRSKAEAKIRRRLTSEDAQ